ncbi:MAG: hypothetical protein HGJ93_06615 [Desulfosarcina sp.]|nr:hypothetical protein [Desulfosarcina sp.]MBC2765619.1 hypothetical protein [Desulfosarcina sp.]
MLSYGAGEGIRHPTEIFQEAMSRHRYIIRSESLDRLLEMAGDIQRLGF